MPDWAIWILVGLAFGVLEMVSVAFFAALFALGAVVASLFAVFTDSWPLQAIVFTASSVVFMWLLRPYLVNIYGGERKHTGAERVIGTVGIVVQEIDNLQGVGQIRANGEIWTARSSDGVPIAAGTRVVIKRIEGVKAIVEEQVE
ncbi:MAG: NfeD family protein [Bacillota bacterium]|jgi:membrane protein implicated in regulation of membrane protease activity